MQDITIQSEGKVLSRIVPATRTEELGALLAPYDNIFLVHDVAVGDIAREIASLCPERIKALIPLQADEKSKTLGTVSDICERLLELGADRDAFLLAAGGGITTDICGFAASIYKRGIRFGFVPTTLLAQTDAAIGGKNGVNFLDYKNILGVIRQPAFTFICPGPLSTLPWKEFAGGSAELLKTFIIENRNGNYRRTVSLLSRIAAATDKEAAILEHSGEIAYLVGEAAAVKAGVVSRDQFENGERRKLNLGHTFAHAIEHEARGKEHDRQTGDISHGEAVAIGTVLAARTAELAGLTAEGFARSLAEDFSACGLPVSLPFPVSGLLPAMKKDKKAENGLVHFVLPRSAGDTVIHDMTAEAVIELLSSTGL